MHNIGAPIGGDPRDDIEILKPRDFKYRHAAGTASLRAGVADERLEFTVGRTGCGTDQKHGCIDTRLYQGFDKSAGRRPEAAVDAGREFCGQVENAHVNAPDLARMSATPLEIA